MTAPTIPAAPTTGGPGGWKRMSPRNYIAPAAILAVALLVVGGRFVKAATKGEDPQLQVANAQNAGAAAAQQVLNQLGATTTTEAKQAEAPGYDYLTCTHVPPGIRPEDANPPCRPVEVWPLTEGAREFIGYQAGTFKGVLNTANTRTVFNEMRDMGDVNACDLLLSTKRDPKTYAATLELWRSTEVAPAGAVRLYDCSAKGTATAGTIPTEGQK